MGGGNTIAEAPRICALYGGVIFSPENQTILQTGMPWIDGDIYANMYHTGWTYSPAEDEYIDQEGNLLPLDSDIRHMLPPGFNCVRYSTRSGSLEGDNCSTKRPYVCKNG